MKVDVESLEEFNLLARDGAQEASEALTELTDTQANIDIAKITVVDREDIARKLHSGSYEGVQFDIGGQLSGTVLVTLGRSAIDALTETLVEESAGDDLERNSLEELANIMVGGFMTGWGDHLGTALDMSPPSYLERPEPETLGLDSTGPETDSVLVFQSTVTWNERVADIDIFMAPDQGSLEEVIATEETDEDASLLALDKLSVFSDLTKEGTEAAAQRVESMSGIATSAEIAGISFTPIDDVTGHLDDDSYVGTTVEFEGTPSGFLVILFDEDSARTVAEAMMPTGGDGDELTSVHESAIEELGNIMTSGFIDGWANVLQTSVEHTPPDYVDDMEMMLVEIVTEQLGPFQTHAFIIESVMKTEEVAVDVEVLAIPNEEELADALDALLVDRRDQTQADPDELF